MVSYKVWYQVTDHVIKLNLVNPSYTTATILKILQNRNLAILKLFS